LLRARFGGHTGGYDADPKEYERRVVRFFDDSLSGWRGTLRP
jgi:hypothetical protein